MAEREPRSDAEVRAEDAARAGDDAVERRAVGTASTVVRNRRAEPDADVPRAESRGVYRDLDGRRRIVGAGQVIPDGWDRVEGASVEDRVGAVPTNLEDDVTDGGAAKAGAKRK